MSDSVDKRQSRTIIFEKGAFSFRNSVSLFSCLFKPSEQRFVLLLIHVKNSASSMLTTSFSRPITWIDKASTASLPGTSLPGKLPWSWSSSSIVMIMEGYKNDSSENPIHSFALSSLSTCQSQSPSLLLFVVFLIAIHRFTAFSLSPSLPCSYLHVQWTQMEINWTGDRRILRKRIK